MGWPTSVCVVASKNPCRSLRMRLKDGRCRRGWTGGFSLVIFWRGGRFATLGMRLLSFAVLFEDYSSSPSGASDATIRMHIVDQ